MAQLVHLDNRQVDPYASSKRSVEGKRVARKSNWVEGWWENIGPTPIYCTTKEEVKAACIRQGKLTGRVIIPKCFMKAKSQGKGFEWSF